MMCLIVFSSHSEKAENLIEKSEDVVVVGDITRFVKEFKMDVERFFFFSSRISRGRKT